MVPALSLWIFLLQHFSHSLSYSIFLYLPRPMYTLKLQTNFFLCSSPLEMGAAESKNAEGVEDVQAQLNAIRAQEAVLLKKIQARF
jgi:hypothetical protein